MNSNDVPHNGERKELSQRSRPRDGGREGAVVVPDLDERADQLFREGMDAMEKKWSAKEQCYHESPDTKTRVETLKLYMAYRHGLPIQRIVRIEQDFRDRHAELLTLARTPSGRATLLKLGLITDEWLSQNLPAQSQQLADSQPREKS